MFRDHVSRRAFLSTCSQYGFGATLFPGVLWAMADGAPEITTSMIADAAKVAGVEIPGEYREMMLDELNDLQKQYAAIRELRIPNDVAPALLFDPVLPGTTFDTTRRPARLGPAPRVGTPKNVEDVAFFTVRQLAELLRTRRVSSTALAEMYLERLRRYDPTLRFVITLTEDRARAAAREADREIAAGRYRGPLHGIPWGAKDLLAVKGYPTTWGAGGFEKQTIDEDATVVRRLDEAGAVLVAKLTLGALAMGDEWFGGKTRNPWKLDQGSSGSSAGSAAATAAGCVGFAIGSETLGSISSPSTRTGATGLRPTFGLVPRTGAMALSWSMDKIGPICRSAEDCALVLGAIAGPDGRDRAVKDAAFNWDATRDPRRLRVGYAREAFEHRPPEGREEKPEERERREMSKKFDAAALEVMRGKLGWKLAPVELPRLPHAAMLPLLTAEAAAAFDELTRSGRDRLLTAQGKDDWPNLFRVARLYPAVEYINANRARTLAMERMAEIFEGLDVIVCPTFGEQLLITNLTGHPAVILPNGYRPTDGTPVSLTFLGRLFGEAKLVAAAKAYQEATGFHLKHPGLDAPAGA